MNEVQMRHPNLEAEITVPESAVPTHMASGWMRVEDNPPPTTKPKAPAAAKEKE